YLCAPDGTGLRRLTRFTEEALAGIALGAVDEITFAGAGGRQVQMFLMHPPEAGSPSVPPGSPSALPAKAGIHPAPGGSNPLPLVHMIHGGPHGVFGDQWHWRWNGQVVAGRGWRVAFVNFHGSTSWGQEFAASILGRWGDQPYADIIAATDHLVATGLA